MKAIQVHEFGGPEVLKLEEIPTPKPGAGQVLVKVHAAGVNPYDTYMRTGTYAIKPPLPYTPGSDAAGVVETVGDGVKKVKAGDRVRTPIDHFVFAKLEQKGLAPNGAASRTVLIRRAYADLIGIPPTPEQVDAAITVNVEARLAALKMVLLLMAGVALLLILPSRLLPDYKPGDMPDNPPPATPEELRLAAQEADA